MLGRDLFIYVAPIKLHLTCAGDPETRGMSLKHGRWTKFNCNGPALSLTRSQYGAIIPSRLEFEVDRKLLLRIEGCGYARQMDRLRTVSAVDTI